MSRSLKIYVFSGLFKNAVSAEMRDAGALRAGLREGDETGTLKLGFAPKNFTL